MKQLGVNFQITVDLPNTMVDLHNTMIDLPNTMIELPNTLKDFPNTMVGLPMWFKRDLVSAREKTQMSKFVKWSKHQLCYNARVAIGHTY